MDAIVCGISKNLEPQGSLSDGLKVVGGAAYIRSYQQMIEKRRQQHVKCSDVFKCEGGNLGTKFVLHAVINKVVESDKGETDAYEDCIASILEKVKRNGWKLIAIPMIGTGTIQTNKRKLKLCGIALVKALDGFIIKHGDKHELKEIHLVNNKHAVDSAVEEAFDKVYQLQGTTGTEQGNTDVVSGRSTRMRPRQTHSRGKPFSLENCGSYFERQRPKGYGRVGMKDRHAGTAERVNDELYEDDSDDGILDLREASEQTENKSDENLMIIDD